VLVGRLDEASPFVTLDGSEIREVAGAVSLPTQNQSLAEATVPVGGETQAHLHRVSEELYVFTSGMGRVRVDQEERDVRAGDTVVLPPGAEHKLWNIGDVPLKLLCCCAPPYSDDDTVITDAAS
jgi:mannose-6-phosphate isomerase-like protein (cupin superfamily)